MVKLNEVILNEFVKRGYARNNGNKVWDISDRKFLFLTPELIKGFLKIREWNIYKERIAAREKALIRTRSGIIAEEIKKQPFNLIDIYCTDGSKAIEFISSLGDGFKIRYCPVNVNKELVDLSLKNIRGKKFDSVFDYNPLVSDCDGRTLNRVTNKLKDKTYKTNVVLLLRSVLASYEINSYLFELSKDMKIGDYLVIGNGIRLGERLVNLETYKHPIWDEWFINLMRGLGFKDSEVKYDVRFGNSRIEAFYKIKADKIIEFKKKKIEFKTGDEVLVAVLYKYYLDEFDKFCKMYFSQVDLFKDDESEYALVFCRK